MRLWVETPTRHSNGYQVGGDMVGVVVATHGDLATEFVRAAELILGPMEKLVPVGFDPEEPPEQMETRLQLAIERCDGGDGVLVLVDMFGGTPSNLSIPWLREGQVEIVSGINLPMLLRVVDARHTYKLVELAKQARHHGEKNILIVSEIMEARRRM